MGEKTVVFKDEGGLWSHVHLNADGEPWIHGRPVEKKDDALAAAGLAWPAWPVEEVDENPWIAVEEE